MNLSFKPNYKHWSIIAILAGITALVGVLILTTSSRAQISPTLPNDSGPQTYLGIGWYRNFDGYAAELGVYYDTWSSNRTVDIRGSMTDIYLRANCKNPNPSMIGQTLGSNEAYATVRISVTNGNTLTYRINRTNFCRHLDDGNLNNLNSRTSLNSARLVGRYQLPLGTPSGVDEETGKYKVTVRIAFTPKVIASKTNELYNPNAYFRIRATGGLVAALGSTESDQARKLNTRAYTNTLGYYSQTVDFGSPCSLASGQKARFGLYDPDNYFDNGNVSGTQGYARPFVFYIEERAAGASGYTPMPQSRYTVVGGSSRGQFVNRSNLLSRFGATSLPNGVTAIESVTRIPAGDNANSASTLVDFTPQVDAKYRLRLVDVYTINYLQIVVPFDGIYNAINCDRGTEVEPLVTISDKPAILGENFSTTARIRNNGSVNNGSVNYTYRVWYDRTGNRIYNPGPDVEVDPKAGNNFNVNRSQTRNVPGWINGTINRPEMAEICVELVLTGLGSTTVNPRRAVDCSSVGRFPQVQISGSDVISRSHDADVSTMVHAIGGRNYGSWVEYSIFSAGPAVAISGAALPASSYNSTADRNVLTFANTINPAGRFAGGLDITIGDRLSLTNGPWQTWPEQLGLGSTLNNPSSQLSPNHVNKRSGSVTISEGNWTGIDQSYVIHATGNVTISAKSISYDSRSYTNIDDLPQLVIIANGNIYIERGVENIDAWLIAGGVVNTCGTGVASPYFEDLHRNICSDQLRINGPVQTGNLQLRRTGGAGEYGTSVAERAKPAEIINLRSDAYLWAYRQASSSQTIRTDSVKELPPRF